MGLDGISINQLGIGHDTSTTKIVRTSTNENQFKIDGLNKGQIVETKKENRERNSQQDSQNNSEDTFDETENDKKNTTEENIVKYDLTDNTKYSLKIDKKTNAIIIYDKKTNTPLQKINPDVLSQIVNNLSNSKGFTVNRRL